MQKIYSKIVNVARSKISELLEIYLTLQMCCDKIQKLENYEEITKQVLAELSNIALRKVIEKKAGIRADRCLEYAKAKHVPKLKNFVKILNVLMKMRKDSNYERLYQNIVLLLVLREKLMRAIDLLGISYSSIAQRINPTFSSSCVTSKLKGRNLWLKSVSEVANILAIVMKEIENRIFDERLINDLELFEFANAQIFWDI